MQEVETAGMAAVVEGDKGPRADLLDSRLSHLAMLKEIKLPAFVVVVARTSESEAVGTGHAPAVTAGTAASPEPVSGADMMPSPPPPHKGLFLARRPCSRGE